MAKKQSKFATMSCSEIVAHLNTFYGRYDIRQARAELKKRGYDTFYDSYLEQYCLA